MKKLKVEDWLDFTFLSSLRFDHKGENFVVATKKPRFNQNIYANKLYLSKNGRFIPFGTSKDFNPKWSKKDDKIAFLRKNKKSKDSTYLCIYDVAASSIVEREIKKIVVDFEWYDSNTFILLCLDKSKDREKGVYEAAQEIPFFSNENGFVSGDRNRVYKYKLDTSKLSLMSSKNIDVEGIKVIDRKVYFLGREVSLIEKKPMITDVYIVNKRPVKLTFSDKHIADFDVKNGYLVFVGSDFEYGLITDMKLFLMNLETKKVKKLLKDSSVSLGNSVNSDSHGSTRLMKATDNFIYCEGTRKDRSVLYKVSYNGNYEVIEKDYSFDDFDVNDNGDILFVKNSSHTLPNLFILSDGKEKLVRKFNKKEFPFAVPEKFKVGNVDAWIIKPFNFNRRKKYPMILEIHGGPKTVYGEGLMFEFQLLASMGYVVVYSNPFGSDGYGQEFADLRGKYGTVDYDDLMKVVDYALDNFEFIDKERLGVTGGSYGGFMTNWIIGHTDRFKAAVTQRSISNWVSMFGISDIGYFFSGDHIAKSPWDNQDEYILKSPLTYAKNFKTPTLIIHSKQDYRCPVPEAYQLFTALRYYGVEARMVLFENENHNLSRTGKPKQKTRRLIEILNWFDKHLKEKK